MRLEPLICRRAITIVIVKSRTQGLEVRLEPLLHHCVVVVVTIESRTQGARDTSRAPAFIVVSRTPVLVVVAQAVVSSSLKKN